MKIERPIYMQQLIDSKDNGLIKIVTGLIWHSRVPNLRKAHFHQKCIKIA